MLEELRQQMDENLLNTRHEAGQAQEQVLTVDHNAVVMCSSPDDSRGKAGVDVPCVPIRVTRNGSVFPATP